MKTIAVTVHRTLADRRKKKQQHHAGDEEKTM
jgi:hypothetical protein